MAAGKGPRARLFHIRDEIEGVAVIINGLSFEQYQASYIHRRAIERAAQIVSEAAKALPADLLARHGDAPWKSIVGIGNIFAARVPAPRGQATLGNCDYSPARAGACRAANDPGA